MVKLEEQLKWIQQKLDLIRIYRQLETLSVLPVKFRKKDDTSDAIKKQVLQEVVEFAKKRIAEIGNDCGLRDEVLKPEVPSMSLKNEEVECLKLLAQKVLNKSSSKEISIVQVEKKMIKEEAKTQLGEKLYKILALSNINPPKFTLNMNAYDEVRLLSMKGDIAVVEDIMYRNRFEIPMADLELK